MTHDDDVFTDVCSTSFADCVAHAPKEQGGFVSFTTLLVSAVLIVLIAASLQWALSTFGAAAQTIDGSVGSPSVNVVTEAVGS